MKQAIIALEVVRDGCDHSAFYDIVGDALRWWHLRHITAYAYVVLLGEDAKTYKAVEARSYLVRLRARFSPVGKQQVRIP